MAAGKDTATGAGKVRVDKWLWAVRLYKTRTLASAGCRNHEVLVNGDSVKPSRLLQGTETIRVERNQRVWLVNVLELIDKRVSASRAVQCYEDNSPPPPPKAAKNLSMRIQGLRPKGLGRPTKRDRRKIEALQGEE